MKTLALLSLSSMISPLALAACDAAYGDTQQVDTSDSGDESSDTSSTGDEYRGFVVLDPGQRHLDRDATQWAAAWWAWALSLPATDHPLLDPPHGSCDGGQLGPVYFLGSLAGLSRESVRAEPRRCTLPQGAVVLVPIVNATLDAAAHGGSEDELRSDVARFVDDMELVVLQIDGETIAGSDLDAHRVGSYRGRYELPESDSVLDFLGMQRDASVVDPTFGDGIYVLVALEPGVHELHIAALDVRDPEDDADDLVIDVHYEITIADLSDGTAPHS
jgi:hypothetical protein